MLSEVWKRGEFEFVDIHKRMSNIRLKYIRCWVFLFLVILNIEWEWNNIIIKRKDEKKLESVNVIRSDISSTYDY